MQYAYFSGVAPQTIMKYFKDQTKFENGFNHVEKWKQFEIEMCDMPLDFGF